MDFLSNTWLVGAVVFLLVWIIRRAGWAQDSKQAVWLTFGVSVVLAIVQTTLEGGWGVLPAPPVDGDPFALIAWLMQAGSVVAASFGKVLAASQIIYQALKASIAKWWPELEI